MPTAGRLEYIIDLNDKALYAGLQKANAAMQAAAGQQSAAFGTVGQASTQASRQISQNMQSASTAVTKHGKDMHNMLGMIEWRLKYLAVSASVYAGMAGIGAVTAAFGAATVSGIKFQAMMEQSTIAMTSMLGSVSSAADMLSRIYKMAAESPFDFPDYVTGAQRLIAYGVAAKDVEKSLLAIADATAAVGGSTEVFTRMSFSLGQMVSQGKITAREMRELAMAGVPAWSLLAEQLGMTVAQLQKISETTGIAASVGIPALLAGIEQHFGGMTQKMMDTWAGLTTTIQDETAQMMGRWEEPLFEGLKGQMMQIRDWLIAFNAESKQIGFMAALEQEAPNVAEVLQTIQASLEAVWDTFKGMGAVVSTLWKAIPEQGRSVLVFFAELGVATLVVSKLLQGLASVQKSLIAMSVLKGPISLLGDLGFAFQAVRGGAATAAEGLAMVGRSALSLVNPLTLAAAAIAAIGYAVMQNRKHLDDMARQSDALAGSAATLVKTMGGEWVDVVAAKYKGAAQASADFLEKNDALIDQIERLRGNASAAQGLAVEIAYELQLHGMDPAEIVRTVQQLFDAAKVTLTVDVSGPTPEEYVQAAAEVSRQALADLEAAQNAMNGSLQGLMESNPLQRLIPSLRGGLQKAYDEAKVVADAESKRLGRVSGEAFYAGYVESIEALSSAPNFEMAARAFATALGDVDLAEANFTDINDFMNQSLGSSSEMLNDLAHAWRANMDAGMTSAEAFAAAEASVASSVDAGTDAMQRQADAAAALADTLKEAADAWQKELEAQYDVGDAINDALRRKQQALDDAASRQNQANQRAAEAQKKAIDAQADAEIKAIEKVRDARLAELKAKEAERQKELSDAERIGNVLGAQIARDRIKALEEEQSAVSEQAQAEIQSLRDRATAQKDAVEAVKVSAEEATLSITEITAALADAETAADEYLANLANLPQDIRQAIRDSGLTPEQKAKLAEELVVGSESDRERAFAILREMAERRSRESAEQWATYDQKMSTLSAQVGQNIVDALVAKLAAGGDAVYGAVADYSDQVAKALNPILKALGQEEIPVQNQQGRIFGVQGVSPNIAWAQGGIMLPDQATIQQPVGNRGLVQWAEPETGGEAFIPLSAAKRGRSIDIWAKTGRLLGVFADGGVVPEDWGVLGLDPAAYAPFSPQRSPSLSPPSLLSVTGDPRLSMAHTGNMGMISAYELANTFLGGRGAVGGGGAGFFFPAGGPVNYQPGTAGYAGMVPTTEGIWNVVKAFFPGIEFWGGRGRTDMPGDHDTGHAFDVHGSWAMMQAVADFLAMHDMDLPLKYHIFNQQIYNPSIGRYWRDMADRGNPTANHMDHVHVSTYDQGGMLMPGLTLAYNGTGAPEAVTSFAGGGFLGFTGGTGSTLTYTDEMAKASDAASAEFLRAAAAADVYAAALTNLMARSASTEEQIAMLNEQLAATTAMRDAKQTMYDLAKAAGATDEELATLQVTIYGLDTEVANLEQQVSALDPALAEMARALEEATRAFEASRNQISNLNVLLGILTQSAETLGQVLEVQRSLIAAYGAEYEAALAAIAAATDPAVIAQWTQQAVSALNSMFQTTLAMVNDNYDRQAQAVTDAQEEWRRGWQARYDAVRSSSDGQVEALRDASSALRDAHELQMDDLNDFYAEKLRVMDEKEREIDLARARARSAEAVAEIQAELASIYGQAGKSTADIARIQDLKQRLKREQREAVEEQEDWLRDEERRRLEAERDAAKESLRIQQEAAEEALASRIEAAQQRQQALIDGLEAERKVQEAYFEGQLEKVGAQRQAIIDQVVQFFADLVQAVINGTADLLALPALWDLINSTIPATGSGPITASSVTQPSTVGTGGNTATGGGGSGGGTSGGGYYAMRAGGGGKWFATAAERDAFIAENPHYQASTQYASIDGKLWDSAEAAANWNSIGLANWESQLAADWAANHPNEPDPNDYYTRDLGGILPPGLSHIANLTGKPEYILNQQQFQALLGPDGRRLWSHASRIGQGGGATDTVQVNVAVQVEGGSLSDEQASDIKRTLTDAVLDRLGRNARLAAYMN